MRKVQLYIGGRKLDLFDDEKIEVTSSIQNVSDISKVFTDFSQSFTVPCSPNNNSIFQHFYNSDVDGTFSANTRVEGSIEIENVPFRIGKWQLEESEIKTNTADNYKVTFYGEVITLKDLFGEDKLKDLDYSSITYSNTGSNVKARIDGSANDFIKYPLITSSKLWNYELGGANDISNSATPMAWSELFPALTDGKILDIIEAQYGVTFTGNFRNQTRFTSQYTWWKNRETTNFTNQSYQLIFNVGGTGSLYDSIAHIDYVDLSTITPPVDLDTWYNGQHRVTINITTNATIPFYIDLYYNGVLSNSYTSTNPTYSFYLLFTNTPSLNKEISYRIRCTEIITGSGTINTKLQQQYLSTLGGVSILTIGNQTENIDIFTTTNNFDFNFSAPDIKVSDWFKGTLQQFNATCYPIASKTFQIEPLDDWYRSGKTVDITKYVITDTIRVARLKLFKRVSFAYEKSKSFLNEQFFEFFGREFASAEATFDNDGTDFKVKVPFENILQTQLSDSAGELTGLVVGYCLTKAPDYKPYVPKPVKLYNTVSSPCSFYFNDGATTTEITSYVPLAQEMSYNTFDYSNSFKNEQSTLTNQIVDNSLYQVYYDTYINSVFNPKSRKVTLEAQLPLSILTNLELNDQIIVRERKYLIDEYKSDLTSGKVNLTLVSSFYTGVIETRTPPPLPPIKPTGGTVVLPVKPTKKGSVSLSFVGGNFTTPDPALPLTTSTEYNQEFEVPVNATPDERIDSVLLEYYDENGDLIQSDVFSITQLGNGSYLTTDTDDQLLTDDLDELIE